ncbi:MAG: YkgJ family cysteine cluster protein [Planctomycetaceae bacterium]
MPGFPLELPTLQNWSCHNCSGCCRQHGIFITDEEKQRIEQQRWTAADGIDPDLPVVIRVKGNKGRQWRLAHTGDGACVFLNEQGLCRIHAKFGEAAKPIACRIYPYAFHPAGKKVAVGLRFSCPSVVKNLGRPVRDQVTDLKALANAVVPDHATSLPAPEIVPGHRLEWTEFHKLNRALDETFADSSAPFLAKLLRALTWVSLVEQSQLNLVDGVRIEDYLHAIREAAAQDNPADVRPLLPRVAPPSAAGRIQFRQLAGQYVRTDTFAADRSLRGRLQLLRNVLRLTRGHGLLPAIREPFVEVPFDSLEQPFGELPAGAEEILTRYYRVKIQSLHYCGPAFYDRPFVEGFYSLALVYPCVMWIARWLAAGTGRNPLVIDDVATALATVDHHHGYNRSLASWSARRRVKTLMQMGDLLKLCAWYSR